MTIFWISAVAIAGIAAFFIALPFVRTRTNRGDEELRDDLNKAIYKDRLEELEVETAEGIVVNKDELVTDLKQSLLDDIPKQEPQEEDDSSPKLVLLFSVILMIVVTFGVYQKFGALDEVEEWQTIAKQLPELSQKLMAPEGNTLNDQEMLDLSLALRSRLHQDSSDARGWLLLGRIGLSNRDISTAIGAMERAYRIDPENEDIKLGLAQSLMLSGDEADQNQAQYLLQEMASQEYVDLRVFSLLAFSAFERGDFPGAIKNWGIMLELIGPDDSRAPMLERSIASAQAKMGQSVEGMIMVELAVGEGINLPSEAVLIVSVHRADGSPMPVAAARYSVGTFPRTIVIDDGNAMMEGSKVSDLDAYIVRARIDNDGNVSTRDGDWFGESNVTQKGETSQVVIDSRY